jgi:hypothetical protein
MPPTDRLVPRFAAEPPHEPLPYGRWAERLAQDFMAACLGVDTEGEELGELTEIVWYPDRTYEGQTYVPATANTTMGHQVYGHVAYPVPDEGREPGDLEAKAEFTTETAERNPDWTVDLCDDPIGTWRGEREAPATVTLVWGRPTHANAVIATAELGGVTVDQCPLMNDRFSLIAPDDYRSDTLEVVLWDRGGNEVARESLYAEDED